MPWGFITHPFIRCFGLSSACAVAVCSAAEPALKKTIVVPLRLAGNYTPAAIPARPIDEKLRVGIIVPVFDRGKSATWTEPVEWSGGVNPFEPIPPERVTAVNQVFVDAAEPVVAAVPKIFRRLFPRATVLTTRFCAACDVIFIVTAQSKPLSDYQNTLIAVTVTLEVTVVTRNVVNVTSFSGKGTGRRTKNKYWSSHTMARSLGEPALRDAMEQLFADLVNGPSLKTFVADKAAERTRPSDLVTTVTFDDTGSFFPNGRLDAGEDARLRFTIRNQGEGAAFAVSLRLETAARSVKIPAQAEVGNIPAGTSREIAVPLSGAMDIDTAQPQVRVETLEQRGYGGRPVIMHLTTERLRPPTLEIADVTLQDRAHGDGDGRPSNGETLEAVILVRNSGLGPAAGAVLSISATPGVEVIPPSVNVDAIAVNAVKEVRTVIRIPITFTSPDLRLLLKAVETRGVAAAAVEADERWPVQVKRPRIEIGFRLFDGNSSRSSGNRNGVGNNGETLEIALTARNRGPLAARSVRLAIVSSIAGLEPKPSNVDVGELPPFAESTEHRIQVAIPRTVGRDGLVERLPLHVAISQADFPAGEQTIAVPFLTLRPALIATVTSQAPLVEGKPALFAIDIRNQGLLAAENVSVDVSCDNAAVELLDASGTPARTVRIDVGSIHGETAAARIQLKAHVRRNIAAVEGMLRIAVAHRDFTAVSAHMMLTILKEEPALVTAVQPPAPEPAITRAAGVPATVSFQRYRDGSRLADATVGLAFEVQSQMPLETVRLEHNQRVIELPKHSPVAVGGSHVWQFEPQVDLEYGANEFEVVVITTDGVRSTRSMTLYREKPRGKLWIAVIGVSRYREPTIASLEFAKEDAVAVHAYYRTLGLPREQVIELLDGNATLANIKRSLGTELMKNASNPDDMVLIYFAGHGQMEADRSSADSDGYSKYFLPHDANPADLFGSALSMEELSRILQRLRSERVVLVIDSCFSGAAGGRTPFEQNLPSRGVITEEFLSRMASVGKGRVILTASGGREVARESRQWGHGIFTHFLLEGLRGTADLDHDGRIDVDEIYKYVSEKVSSATRGQQNPMRKSPNLTGTIVIGGRLE